MPSVIFEFDYKFVVNDINSHSTPHNEIGDIITRCKDLLSSHDTFIMSYVNDKQIRSLIV